MQRTGKHVLPFWVQIDSGSAFFNKKAARTTNIVTLKCIVAQTLDCIYLSSCCNKESPSPRKSFKYCCHEMALLCREDNRIHIIFFKNSHTHTLMKNSSIRISDPGNPGLIIWRYSVFDSVSHFAIIRYINNDNKRNMCHRWNIFTQSQFF